MVAVLRVTTHSVMLLGGIEVGVLVGVWVGVWVGVLVMIKPMQAGGQQQVFWRALDLGWRIKLMS